MDPFLARSEIAKGFPEVPDSGNRQKIEVEEAAGNVADGQIRILVSFFLLSCFLGGLGNFLPFRYILLEELSRAGSLFSLLFPLDLEQLCPRPASASSPEGSSTLWTLWVQGLDQLWGRFLLFFWELEISWAWNFPASLPRILFLIDEKLCLR